MNENLKHKISLPLQLLIGLSYFFLLFITTLLNDDSGSSFDLKDDSIILAMKISQVVVVTLVFILPVNGFAYLFRSEKTAFLNLKKVNSLSLVTALTICVLALPFIGILQEWNTNMVLPAGWEGIEEWMKEKEKTAEEITSAFFVDKSFGSFLINLFVIAFMAALSEELFFRGFLQRLFIENKINVHLAIWITAILFSAIHVQFYGFFARMVLGAILGYLYLYSGSLWTPILAHFVNNAFAVFLVHFASVDLSQTEKVFESDFMNIAVAVVSFAIISFQIYYLRKKYISH